MVLRPSARAQANGSWQATSTSAGALPVSRSRTAPPTTYESCGSFVSAGKSSIRRSRNDIPQRADPLDLHLDRIAGVERSDAGGGGGGNHLARQQGDGRRDEL